uniref:Proteasome alpha-type subunits domain-containing protein n=1 Tax=Arcella intermedia TaxID=1963864 RepID=A0A6B2LG53_9EUKA|eukprot:TRINITY_DN21_c0_g3_i1.p1 TRINITY_DN21_c0_g3~~TRINITY_DN21_c0_g3_i1.p1  ORF type:complete len:236 (+),score=53.86 TRINITY_DN21_c0_g3_i1:57-764(+)
MAGSYGFSLTTFSPTGNLVQIEYALNAVAQGATTIGIKGKNGVVLATEKKLPLLTDETSVKKIELLTDNIGISYSGMGPDFRLLVRKGRKKAQEYQKFYKEPIPLSMMVRELATIMQEFTQSGGVRPFGVSLMVAGYDDKGPQLYQVDPSGSYFAWKASAIGRGMVAAKSFLELRAQDELPNLTTDDAIHRAIRILKEGFQGEIDENNIEVGVVGEDRKFITLSAAKIRDFLGEV